MIIQTKYFGEVSYDETDTLHFPEGLFGFEDEKEFLLIPFGDDPQTASLLCLQSTATGGLAFVVMNPFYLNPDYAPVLQPAELRSLEATESQELCYYVLCVVREPVSESTVNFKCPVAINDTTRVSMQVILETDSYNMRHLLSEFQKKEAGETC